MRGGLIVFLLLTSTFCINTNPTGIMTRSQDIVGPGSKESPMMTYDSFNNVTVMFGGNEETDDMWFYDYSTNEWTEYVGTTPSGRGHGAMTYCSETNEIILYGGQGHTDTWSFDCESQMWSDVSPATNPDIYDSHAISYDPVLNVIILFGGIGAGSMISDSTWSFDCETRDWIALHPIEFPRARYGHVITYDSSIEKMLMTCGSSGDQGFLNDTWTYDTSTNTWSEIVVEGNVDALKWSSMVYDSINEKNILFGGNTPDIAVHKTRIYDTQTNTWADARPDSSPGPRVAAGLAFDSKYGIAVLHGGMAMDGNIFYGDTWIYSYPTNTWTSIDTLSETTTGTTSSEPPPQDLLWVISIIIIIGTFAVIVVIITQRRHR